MSIKQRLARLEQRVRDHPLWRAKGETLTERMAERQAYYRGETPRPPDPPCPPWIDSGQWDSRMRIGRQLDSWVRGERPVGDYLPEMTDAERLLADGYWQEIQAAAETAMLLRVVDGGATIRRPEMDDQ
jgi:hypothetical protein